MGGHRFGVAGDSFGEAVIYDPVSHPGRRPVVDEVHDRDDLQRFDEIADRLVDPRPVVDSRLGLGLVPGDAVPDRIETHVLDEVQVFFPLLIVLHLLEDIQEAPVAVLDRIGLGDPAVFDADAPIEPRAGNGFPGRPPLS